MRGCEELRVRVYGGRYAMAVMCVCVKTSTLSSGGEAKYTLHGVCVLCVCVCACVCVSVCVCVCVLCCVCVCVCVCVCACVCMCICVCVHVCDCVMYRDPHRRSSHLPSASSPNQTKHEHNEQINKRRNQLW